MVAIKSSGNCFQHSNTSNKTKIGIVEVTCNFICDSFYKITDATFIPVICTFLLLFQGWGSNVDVHDFFRSVFHSIDLMWTFLFIVEPVTYYTHLKLVH